MAPIKRINKVIQSCLEYFPSVAIAGVVVIPLIFVLQSAFHIDGAVWQRLWSARIPALLANSAMLVVTVTIGSVAIGFLLAFLIERTDLPLRRIFRPLLIAPLITPCYIIAICYVNFFGINGLGEKLFATFGITARLPSIYGFWGAAAILTMGAYPYIYTTISASLQMFNERFTEAAKCLGQNGFERLLFLKIPLLLPALTSGMILVAFYVLSDFGVVSMLRYPTFVNTIYEQMTGRYNYATASALSSILIGLTILLFIIQDRLLRRKVYQSVKIKKPQAKAYQLGLWKIPAAIFVVLVISAGLIIPVGILIYWFWKSFSLSASALIWMAPIEDLIHSGVNSIGLSSVVATITVVLTFPLAYLSIRQPSSVVSRWLTWLAQSGIALPGVLIALGLLLVFKKLAPHYTFSIAALILAFFIHFFAQSFQTTSSGLKQISKKFEESARLLGNSSLQSFWWVTRPLLNPVLATAWILVFLSSMRELPASLLLRPAGFDPLTVKVWTAASEGFYEQSAAPALLIVLLSLPLIIIMTRAQERHTTSTD